MGGGGSVFIVSVGTIVDSRRWHRVLLEFRAWWHDFSFFAIGSHVYFSSLTTSCAFAGTSPYHSPSRLSNIPDRSTANNHRTLCAFIL